MSVEKNDKAKNVKEGKNSKLNEKKICPRCRWDKKLKDIIWDKSSSGKQL